MSIKIRKGQAALLAMILALGAAVFINWYYTSPKAETKISETSTSAQKKANLGDAEYVGATAVSQQDEAFAEYTVERQTAHDKARETLQQVISDSSSSPAAVEEASKALEELSTAIKRESDLETLISAKTGSDSIVIIDGGDIKVITAKGALNDTVTMQIKELILSEGDFLPEKISIFEVK